MNASRKYVCATEPCRQPIKSGDGSYILLYKEFVRSSPLLVPKIKVYIKLVPDNRPPGQSKSLHTTSFIPPRLQMITSTLRRESRGVYYYYAVRKKIPSRRKPGPGLLTDSIVGARHASPLRDKWAYCDVGATPVVARLPLNPVKLCYNRNAVRAPAGIRQRG